MPITIITGGPQVLIALIIDPVDHTDQVGHKTGQLAGQQGRIVGHHMLIGHFRCIGLAYHWKDEELVIRGGKFTGCVWPLATK